jgi:hypothetical protein
MFITVELLYRTWGRQKGKENNRELTILKYITSVQVQDKTIYIKSCGIMAGGMEGVRESNERGQTDQSKVYSHR